MKTCMWSRFLFCFAAAVFFSAAFAGDMNQKFVEEEIKPYIKIMQGPWVSNVVSGTPGKYRIAAKVPANAQFVLGLFDNKVGRTGADERCAVVLVDGVNPLAPSESVPVSEIDGADVSGMRKIPLDGLSFNAQDPAGKDCTVKVVDAKEEYEVGPVKPFSIPAGRSGKNLGRVDVFVFAGSALPPSPGQTVAYGAPLAKFAMLMEE